MTLPHAPAPRHRRGGCCCVEDVQVSRDVGIRPVSADARLGRAYLGHLIVGRAKWGGILQAVEGRISQGDDMTLSGPLGLSAELRRKASGLPRLEPTGPDERSTAMPGDDLTVLREEMGADQRGVHLVHVVAPSEGSNRNFDVFAYLYG